MSYQGQRKRENRRAANLALLMQALSTLGNSLTSIKRQKFEEEQAKAVLEMQRSRDAQSQANADRQFGLQERQEQRLSANSQQEAEYRKQSLGLQRDELYAREDENFERRQERKRDNAFRDRQLGVQSRDQRRGQDIQLKVAEMYAGRQQRGRGLSTAAQQGLGILKSQGLEQDPMKAIAEIDAELQKLQSLPISEALNPAVDQKVKQLNAAKKSIMSFMGSGYEDESGGMQEVDALLQRSGQQSAPQTPGTGPMQTSGTNPMLDRLGNPEPGGFGPPRFDFNQLVNTYRNAMRGDQASWGMLDHLFGGVLGDPPGMSPAVTPAQRIGPFGSQFDPNYSR